MLKSFLKLFEDSHKQNEPAYTVELATAALLSEIVNADNQVTETEREEYEKQLRKHVNVDDDAMALLLKRGQETADDAIDLVHFTQVLNKHCNADERVSVVKAYGQSLMLMNPSPRLKKAQSGKLLIYYTSLTVSTLKRSWTLLKTLSNTWVLTSAP